MSSPDLMSGERRQLYLLYARYMRVTVTYATAIIEEEHDSVVDMWDRYYAARDRAEQAGDHS